MISFEYLNQKLRPCNLFVSVKNGYWVLEYISAPENQKCIGFFSNFSYMIEQVLKICDLVRCSEPVENTEEVDN